MPLTRMRAGAATGILEAVTAGGGSWNRVLAAAGLAPPDLADPDRMLPSERLLALFDAADGELGDDASCRRTPVWMRGPQRPISLMVGTMWVKRLVR